MAKNIRNGNTPRENARRGVFMWGYEEVLIGAKALCTEEERAKPVKVECQLHDYGTFPVLILIPLCIMGLVQFGAMLGLVRYLYAYLAVRRCLVDWFVTVP